MINQTSLEAYDGIKPHMGELHQKIKAELSLCIGTRDELSERTGIAPNTLRPRIRELIDNGEVGVVGVKRNENGRNVEILTLTPFLLDYSSKVVGSSSS